MKTIELETQIDQNAPIDLPREFQYAFGKSARLIVFLPEQESPVQKQRRPGSAKGMLRVLSEDDDHLIDFKEHMT